MPIKFKVNPSSLQKAKNDTSRLLKEVIRDTALLNEIGEATVRDIKGQTRRGVSNVTEEKFKSLTPKWVQKRTEIAKSSGPSDVFSPKRSNLSLTGQLVNSIIYVVDRGLVRIFADGDRKPYSYRTKKGEIKEIKSKIDNAELSRLVSKDRPFIGVRKRFEQNILQIVNRFLRRRLRPRRRS